MISVEYDSAQQPSRAPFPYRVVVEATTVATSPAAVHVLAETLNVAVRNMEGDPDGACLGLALPPGVPEEKVARIRERIAEEIRPLIERIAHDELMGPDHDCQAHEDEDDATDTRGD